MTSAVKRALINVFPRIAAASATGAGRCGGTAKVPTRKSSESPKYLPDKPPVPGE